MILNTGDVPNIYENDEKAEIIEKVSRKLRKSQIYITCALSLYEGISFPPALQSTTQAINMARPLDHLYKGIFRVFNNALLLLSNECPQQLLV